MDPNRKFSLLPLGGCGEIGMNMTVLFVNGDAYFIDCGALFPDLSQAGVQLILPGYSFLASQGIKPKAWIITHGHEDHIGGLPYFFPRFPAPIYTSEFAAELIELKFADLNIRNHTITRWKAKQKTQIGKLHVTPFLVNHSIPDAMGLLIETAHGRILHTGDFRIDDHPHEPQTTDQSIREVLGGQRADLMMSDSTNSFVKGKDLSENDLVPEFSKIMTSSPGAVVVASFSSNIWRAKTVLETARLAGRGIHLLGRGTKRNFEIACRLGIIENSGLLQILEEQDLRHIDRQKICILCTGSQGEPFSGLHRLAYDGVNYFKIEPGDVALFSARAIPGNEKPITFLTNQLCKRGVNVIHAKEVDVHVSGHGFQQDLIDCIKAANPRFFMPVHGEFRHLQKHIELAISAGVREENCVLAENGSFAVINKNEIQVGDQIQAGRSYVCQGGIYVDEGEIYRDRTQLARNGLVVVSIVLANEPKKVSKRSKSASNDKPVPTLQCQPQVSIFGVPIQEEILTDEIPGLLEKAHAATEGRKDLSDDVLLEELRVGIRRYIESICRFRCLVKVILHRPPKK